MALGKEGGERVEEEVSVEGVNNCFEFDGCGDGGGVNILQLWKSDSKQDRDI